jgi:hypothetical protein
MPEPAHGPGVPPRPEEPSPGLCGTCRYSRRIVTARGSVFRLCERSVTDPRYPRYPALPVLQCAGFEQLEAGDRPP